MSKVQIPPHNIEAEKSLLGSILLRNKAMDEVKGMVDVQSFYSNKHKVLYKAMISLHGKGDPVDVVSLSSLLKDHGFIQKIGGMSYIAELVQSVPSSQHATHYADIVMRKYAHRSLVKAADKIGQMGYNEGADPYETMIEVEDTIKSVKDIISIERDLKGYMGEDRVVIAREKAEELEKEDLNQNKAELMTSILCIDYCVDGFRYGQMVIMSGPTKNGKTELGITMTKGFLKHEKKVLWFSQELPLIELFEKFGDSNLDFYVPRKGDRKARLKWIEQRIIEAKQKHGLDAVFIDNLDFLYDKDLIMKGMRVNMADYVGAIVYRLKEIALEQEIVLFLMVHIKKDVWGTNRLPQTNDIRDSGKIPQASDVIIMIVRRREKNRMYDKNRGIVGVVENRYSGKTAQCGVTLVDHKFLQESQNIQEQQEDSKGKKEW